MEDPRVGVVLANYDKHALPLPKAVGGGNSIEAAFYKAQAMMNGSAAAEVTLTQHAGLLLLNELRFCLVVKTF